MEIPDMREFDEIKCPDCGGALAVNPVLGTDTTFQFNGCRCDHGHMIYPGTVMFGTNAGPLTLYRRRSN